jgi:Icc-related predicted phosphoesterase
MPLRICHFSDWHGEQVELPWADFYICTGDMLWNYPKFDRHYASMHKLQWIDPVRECFLQGKDIKRIKFRRYLGNPDAEVVVVRGNHDFLYLSKMFKGGPVQEIGPATQIIDVQGLRIGGFRGINGLVGDWADEMTKDQLFDQVGMLSKQLDILVTHAPPQGIMDKVGAYGRGPNVGVDALSTYITEQLYNDGPLRLHCFGHIHECFGTMTKGSKLFEGKSGITFSNAATGYIVYDWIDGEVTIVESKKNAIHR